MRYRVGGFQIDTARFELSRDGRVRHVEPLVFDLITFFVRHPGRVLTRDEIVQSVWKGRAVSDATISSAVRSARQALADGGGPQDYIRTVRGRGFEFRGEVLAERESEPPEAPGSASNDEGGGAGPSRAPSDAAAVADVPGRDDPPMPSVAVLPLVNRSPDVDDYFADGLTEDLITTLARFRELRTIAGASTFHFKGRDVDLAELRARFRVGFVVQGSVRRSGGRVRISVQLVDAETGVQLWGDRYDRDLGDLFELQDEVTRRIAATLGVAVQDVGLRRALTKSPAELDAYDCLLRARRYTRTLTGPMHAEARDLLERAVSLDPRSADAHALLANVYLAEHRFEMNPRPDPVDRALEQAQLATQLDPQHAYARCWLAIVHFFRGENDRFETESRLAVRLNPNDPETLADVGHYLAFMGAFERGVALSQRARELDPLHPGWYHFSSARLHYHQRAYEEVLADLQRVGLPAFYWTHLLDAASKGQLGRADAGEALARIHELKPGFSARTELKKWNAAPDDLEHILDGLRAAGLRE